MTIDQLMSKDVHYCAPEQTLESAAEVMWTHDCACVPVCDGDAAPRLVGMITDCDICMAALFQPEPLSRLRIRDAMTATVISCRPGDSPDEVEQVMRQRRISRVPVTSEDGRLLGIVSLADLARGAEQSAAAHATATESNGTLAAIAAAGVH